MFVISEGDGFWFCTGFAVSNLASPFGWEVGPLGLGEGELACGVVWPSMCNAVCLNGSCWGRCVGCEAVYVASEFPPSTADAVPLGGRLLAFAYALWGGSKGMAFSWAPALQSYKKIPPRKRWDF